MLIRLVSKCIGVVTERCFSVLIFHRVLQQRDPLNPSELDATRFEQIMTMVGREFRVRPLSDLLARCRNGELSAASVAITFDDGYADNAAIAAPILARLGLPATFFVSSGFLDGGRMWNDTIIETVRRWPDPVIDLRDWGLSVYSVTSSEERLAAIDAIIKGVKYKAPAQRADLVEGLSRRLGRPLPLNLMMSSEQVRGLVESGMDVGAHTVNHPILSCASDDQARYEIQQSKRDLEAIAGTPVTLFAYPNGKPRVDYHATHVAMVKEAGFTAAVSTAVGAAGCDVDAFQIPRFTPWATNQQRFKWQLAANFLRARHQRA